MIYYLLLDIMEFYVILTVLGSVFFISDAAPVSEKLLEEIGEYGGYFEGDMVLTAAQRAEIDKAIMMNGDEESQNGLVAGSYRWPGKTVVYHIKDEFNKRQLEMIFNAFSDIASQTCIKFRKRKSEFEHAVIIQGKQDDCFSSIGYLGSGDDSQVLNLGRPCFNHGIIVHEILHTLGFFHMQSTYDRDQFVTIVWENIKRGMEHNFAKYTRSTVTDFGVPYDYGSVMHYDRTAFSKNGMDTIVPRQANVIMGQRIGLSKSDVLKLNKMYECPRVNNPPDYNNTAIVDID